jgi:hypothetical protein
MAVIVAALIAGAVSLGVSFTNRAQLGRIEVNVNHRLDEALKEVATLRLQVRDLGGDPTDSAPDADTP